ncbi:MAG: hypothetical protein QM729_03100 [Solirubrobacterales bacterium]
MQAVDVGRPGLGGDDPGGEALDHRAGFEDFDRLSLTDQPGEIGLDQPLVGMQLTVDDRFANGGI